MLEFVQDQPRPLRLGPALGWYLLGYVPILGLFGVVEGGVRGMWGWTLADLEYQLGAYVAFAVAGIVLGGLVAVPLHLLLVRALAAQTSPIRFRLLASASAILLLGLLAFGWMFLFTFPVSFLAAATAFGLITTRHLGSPSPTLASMTHRTTTGFLYAAILALSGCAAPSSVPGTNAPAPVPMASTGYGVSLIRIVPAEGTPLTPGQTVIFTVAVAHNLEVADSGAVVLVPQDGAGRRIPRDRPQASASVGRGTGQVTITDTMTVPENINRVRLFVLLAPTGYTSVTGEFVVTYPVRGN
jgi:hypothetical protein